MHNQPSNKEVVFEASDPYSGDIFLYLRDNLLHLVKKEGIYGSIMLVHDAFSKGKINLNQCHMLLHLIGHESYSFYQGDLDKMVMKSGRDCWDAYQHGTEAQVAQGSKNVIEDLEKICQNWHKIYPNTTCYHGAGHGFMELAAYKIPVALERCDGLIGASEDISSCYAGVFSEFGNRVHNFDGNTGTYVYGSTFVDFHYDKPLVFCKSFIKKYQDACNSQLVKLIFRFDDIEGSIIDCTVEDYDEDAKYTCLRMSGMFYTEEKFNKNQAVLPPDILITQQSKLQEAFISGVKIMFRVYGEGGALKDFKPFCNAFEVEKVKNYCIKA